MILDADTIKEMLDRSGFYSRTDRYFLVDVDGPKLSGYQQRPAALNNARYGEGVYDARENKVIKDLDPAERLRYLESSVTIAEGQLSEAREKRDRAHAIQALVDAGEVTPDG